MVIVLDSFKPLQVHNAKHGQRKADHEEYETDIEPPTGKIWVERRRIYRLIDSNKMYFIFSVCNVDNRNERTKYPRKVLRLPRYSLTF